MPRKIKGYSRVDSDRAHGWLVRIQRGDKRRSSFISDAAHGGKRKAMRVAQQLYDDWNAQLPKAETSANKIGARNQSGIVGVHFSRDVDSRYPNCAYDSYVASWLDDSGCRRNVRFSCHKYGHDDALSLACIAREKKLVDRQKVLAIFQRRQRSQASKGGKLRTAASAFPKKTAAKKK